MLNILKKKTNPISLLDRPNWYWALSIQASIYFYSYNNGTFYKINHILSEC